MKNDTGDLNHLLDNYDDIVTKDDWGLSSSPEKKAPNTAPTKEVEDEIDIVEEELRNSQQANEIMKVSISTKSPAQSENEKADAESNKMFIELFSNSSKALNGPDADNTSSDRGNSRGERRRSSSSPSAAYAMLGQSGGQRSSSARRTPTQPAFASNATWTTRGFCRDQGDNMPFLSFHCADFSSPAAEEEGGQ